MKREQNITSYKVGQQHMNQIDIIIVVVVNVVSCKTLTKIENNYELLHVA